MQRRLLLLASVLGLIPGARAQRPGSGGVEVGKPAPSLSLGGLTDTQPVDLGALRGKPTLLFFGSCT